MEGGQQQIKCPNCGEEIDVADVLYHQVDADLKQKYQNELAREKTRYEKQSRELAEQRDALEAERERQDEAVRDAVRAQLKSREAALTEKISKRFAEEQEDQLKSMREELHQKSEQVKELNRMRADMERIKREKDELRETIEAESAKKLNEQLAGEREKIRKSVEEQQALKLAEREQVVEQLRAQLTEAQRKAEQGSMQLQGEVQELAIEQWLTEQFPLDTIEEIKKGAHGGDCVQIVHTRTRQNCGSIYYESKRTRNFSPAWIEKFKHDIRERGADIGVLVTQAMPADMDGLGQIDGVWICSFEEFRGLSIVLRDSLVRVSTAIASQENKGDKMHMLYDFLTGNEFRMQVEAIVEGFTQMRADLDTEKRAMTRLWKTREKQIDKVLLNTNHMYSAVRGIAGNAVQAVSLLELPIDDDDEDES